ncbi:unnamed protein product, partial [marine sediment metagenome]
MSPLTHAAISAATVTCILLATVSSIAGDVITLTANEAYRFGDWGAAPEYMNAANVLLKIQNTTRSEFAWMKA